MCNGLVEPMEFFKIDKMSDDVFPIGPNVILKFNVSLSKTSGGERHHFHKEFEYPVNNPDKRVTTFVTIKRSFDYYLSIENMQKDENGNKAFIRIGANEYFIFKKGLEEAIRWFTDKKYERLFAKNNGKLVLMNPIPNFVMPNLPMQKYIELIPVIIDRGMANADKEPGVRIILSDPSMFVDINLDRLMGLYYIVSSINMYQAALGLLSYLNRPNLGYERINLGAEKSSKQSIAKPKSGASGIEGRFVTPSGNSDIGILEGK